MRSTGRRRATERGGGHRRRKTTGAVWRVLDVLCVVRRTKVEVVCIYMDQSMESLRVCVFRGALWTRAYAYPKYQGRKKGAVRKEYL